MGHFCQLSSARRRGCRRCLLRLCAPASLVAGDCNCPCTGGACLWGQACRDGGVEERGGMRTRPTRRRTGGINTWNDVNPPKSISIPDSPCAGDMEGRSCLRRLVVCAETCAAKSQGRRTTTASHADWLVLNARAALVSYLPAQSGGGASGHQCSCGSCWQLHLYVQLLSHGRGSASARRVRSKSPCIVTLKNERRIGPRRQSVAISTGCCSKRCSPT